MLDDVQNQAEYGLAPKRRQRLQANTSDSKRHSGASRSGRRRRAEDPRQSTSSQGCSAQAAIKLIQGKWKIRILSQLQHRPLRLGELHRLFPQATKKMIAQQLREMEMDGLVTRKDLSERVLRVEYSLSDSAGPAVLNLIRMLSDWAIWTCLSMQEGAHKIILEPRHLISDQL
ncbi:winged helix-turn-helix transcriptional regulator, partial [Terriglobus sp. YAF25]|uniref:winged helix-turn-helix transcriptional regulator n=1 Tax=Terriglobus sp. YAF25 TaxID=3233080 RepID=UPI003F9E728A